MASSEGGTEGEDAEAESSAARASSVTMPVDPEGDEDDDQGEGGALIIAAVLLSISILMAAYALGGALDRSGRLLAGVLAKSDVVLRRAVAAATPPTRAAPTPETDALRRRVVDTAGVGSLRFN